MITLGPDDKVIDVTWEIKDKYFKEDHDKTCVYCRIEIPKDFIRKKLEERNVGTGAYVIGYYLLSVGYFRPV